MSGDEREGYLRCCFELDHVVLPTDIFLLAGQHDNYKTTSWGLDLHDKCPWLFVVFYRK